MYGADLEVDIPYNWMTFFMEDDARLEEVAQLYSSGKLMSGDVKGELITILQKLVADHQEKKKLITDEEVLEWMAVRPIKSD